MPNVSVVIPTRFRPDLVVRAVHSALNQTYSDLEVVVVVDGPDPASFQALMGLQSQRVRVVALEASVGGGEARNTGARQASGKWIALLDDDDEWLPEKIERQLAAAETSTDEPVVVTRYLYKRAGKRTQIWPRTLPGNEHFSEHLFDYCSGFQTSTYFCSRDLFLAHPFRPDLKGHQDWDWLLRVSSLASVNLIVIPDALSVFNVVEKTVRVSESFQWTASLAWARANRTRMTRLAYSRFIAFHCARLAARQQAKAASFFTLAKQCLFVGMPNPRIFILFLSVYLVGPEVRRLVRDLLMRNFSTRATS